MTCLELSRGARALGLFMGSSMTSGWGERDCILFGNPGGCLSPATFQSSGDGRTEKFPAAGIYRQRTICDGATKCTCKVAYLVGRQLDSRDWPSLWFTQRPYRLAGHVRLPRDNTNRLKALTLIIHVTKSFTPCVRGNTCYRKGWRHNVKYGCQTAGWVS